MGWQRFPWYFYLLALAGAALHFGTALLRLGTFWPTPRLIDFGAFYASAWALRSGLSPYDFPADWSAALAARTAMAYAPPPIFNPPLWPALLYPFAFFTYPAAAAAWVLLNLALLAVSTWWLADSARLHGWERKLGLFLVVVTFGPVFLDLSIGQTSVVLLFLALLIGRQLPRGGRRASWIAAGVTALAAGIKLYPLFWAGAFLFLRRWRLFLGTVALGILGSALLFLVFPEPSRSYLLTELPGRVTSAADQVGVDDQALTAWLDRMFRPQVHSVQGLSTSEAIGVTWAPWLTLDTALLRVGGWALVGLISAAAAWVIWHHGRRQPAGAFYLWLVLGLLAFPHIERYNHALLLPAMAWLWPQGRRQELIVLVAYLLTGLARLTHFWVVALPGPLVAPATGFGVLAALLVYGAMLANLARKQERGDQAA
jgi:hypothetical protein